MTKQLFCAAVLLYAANCISATQIEKGNFISVTDPTLEWSQYDEKESKCILKSDGLQLESKKDNIAAITTCELPININDDFRVDLKMKPQDLNEKHPCGVILDFENDNNYLMLLLEKKNFRLVRCSDGKQSVIQKGMYKFKGKEIEVTIERRGDIISFSINELPVVSRKNLKLEYPGFGFVIGNKGKLVCLGVSYKSIINQSAEE